MKYAYGLMNDNKSKREIALDAGFSPSTARVPKSIENKAGLKLAMSQLAGDMANTSMKLMFELQARDMSKMSDKDLLSSLNVMSKTWERFTSRIYTPQQSASCNNF